MPFKRFLENATELAATVQAADVLRQALVDIELGTTGALPVLTAGLPEIQEAVILRDDMVPFGFLRGGITAAQAVAKLLVPRYEDGQPKLLNGKPDIHLGTGWVVAPGLIMTNYHVVNSRNQGEAAASEPDLRAQAAAMSVLFDYDDEGVIGTPSPLSNWWRGIAPLDYALVRITDTARPPLHRAAAAVADVSPGERRGGQYHPASRRAAEAFRHPQQSPNGGDADRDSVLHRHPWWLVWLARYSMTVGRWSRSIAARHSRQG